MAQIIVTIPTDELAEHLNEFGSVSLTSFEIDTPSCSFSWTDDGRNRDSLNYECSADFNKALTTTVEVTGVVDEVVHNAALSKIEELAEDNAQLAYNNNHLLESFNKIQAERNQLLADKAALEQKLNPKPFWKNWFD